MMNLGRRIAVWAIAAAVVVSLGIYAFQQRGYATYYRQSMDTYYQKAFYETVDMLSDIQINLEKLGVSVSQAGQLALLGEISRLADGAQDNLALLPADHETVIGTLKFVNQLGDYSRVLADGLSRGVMISAEDQAQLDALHDFCGYLLGRMELLLNEAKDGQPLFSDDPSSTRTAELASVDDIVEPTTQFPTLIYDGPFSDGDTSAVMRGLGDNYLTLEQAEQAARAFLSGQNVTAMAHVGDSLTPTPSYDFTATTPDGPLDISVSRQGGHVLSMISGAGNTVITKSLDECVAAAKAFLSDRGFPPVALSFWQQFQGVLTVNMAPEQDGVLIYPDLIKLQVNMNDLSIIGFEAANYWRNHVKRVLPAPVLTSLDARGLVSPALSITGERLCVIPETARERLCYEIQGTQNGGQYLVYIDALTGEEAKILKVIDMGDGQLTQ